MPGKTRYPVFIICFIIFILLWEKPVYAQLPVLDKKISFTFTNITLVSALQAIQNKAGVKFSYNPELVQPERRITMRFNNLPLREVLIQLLNDPTISIREIGNQIVLYRGDPSQIPTEPNQHLVQGKPQIVIPHTKKIPDTVYVYQLDTLIINRTDTILRMITLTRYDTIRIVDTVFIEKSKPTQKAGKEIIPNFEKNSVKHRKFLENNGFYSGIYFEMLTGSANYKNTSSGNDGYLQLMKDADAGPLFKFSAGISAGYDYHAVGIRSGIGYTRVGEQFKYAFQIETGGLFETDTVEKFYTLSGIDTTWFYITDSIWIPKDSKKYSYQNPNSFTYIDVPLLLKLRFWQSEKAEIYALGGVNASFLVSVNALHINPADINEVLQTSKSDLNPFLISWQAGLGTALKLSSRSGIIAEASYRSVTTSQYKDLPVDKRYGLFGVKVAAYIKF